jgi:outer membrane protein assembly factor BamB
VFISSGYGSGSELIRLTPAGAKLAARQVWASKDMDNHHGGVIYWDGYLYGSSGRGKWVCFDWKSGETKYSENGVGKGSLTMADGLLYTLSETGGKVALVQPTPAGHQIISEFKIPAGGQGKVWAHPVVCGGRLYIRHDDFLYVYDIQG